MSQTVQPLDRDSPKGRAIAAELTEVLARAQIRIDEEEREPARELEPAA